MANNKATSRSQEDFTADLWSNAQLLKQMLLGTLRHLS